MTGQRLRTAYPAALFDSHGFGCPDGPEVRVLAGPTRHAVILGPDPRITLGKAAIAPVSIVRAVSEIRVEPEHDGAWPANRHGETR
jgi:hypothetical protein